MSMCLCCTEVFEKDLKFQSVNKGKQRSGKMNMSERIKLNLAQALCVSTGTTDGMFHSIITVTLEYS